MRDRSINGFVVLALMLGIVCGWTLRRMVILSAPEAADPAPPDAAARVQVAYQHVVTLTEQRAFLNKALAGLAPQPDDTADVLPMVPDTVSAHATEPSVEVPAAAPAEVPAPALPVEVPAPALPVEVPAAPAQPPASSAQPPAAQAQRPVPAEEPKAPTTPSVAGAAAAQTAAAPTQSAKGLAKAVAYSPRPSAGPGRWRCTRAGGCKYVFYVMPFVGFLGEQFSQQRLAVMETIHIVKALGPEYVLVEPTFIVTPHDNNKIEARIKKRNYDNTEDTLFGRYLLRASELYDLQLLGQYFEHDMGIILWEDFQCLFPGGSMHFDLLLMDHGPVDNTAIPCVTNPRLNANAEFFNVTYTVKKAQCLQAIRNGGYPMTSCQPKAGNCFAAGKPYRRALLEALKGYQEDGRRRVQFHTCLLHGTELLFRELRAPWVYVCYVWPDASLQGSQYIGLFMYRSALSDRLYQWIEDTELDYIAIRHKLLFSHGIWSRAQQIVKGLERPFVAMHIRRGDKLIPDPFRTLDKAVQRIQRVMQHTNSRSVFLMTDIKNQDDLRHLNTSLHSVGGVHLFDSGDWRQEVQDMFVGMAVCTMADYFISSARAYWASATPSRDIIEVRNLVFGFDKFTTYWFGKPGPRWTGAVIDTFTHSQDLLEGS